TPCVTCSIRNCASDGGRPALQTAQGKQMKTRVKKTCMAAALAGVVALAGVSAHAQQPGTLTVLRVADADIYDPIRTTSTREGEVQFKMADTLVSRDFERKTVKPGLAEPWTVSDAGKTDGFVLRKGVK